MLVLGIERGSNVGFSIRLLCAVVCFVVGGKDCAVGVDVERDEVELLLKSESSKDATNS
jgi:hypothetical protein